MERSSRRDSSSPPVVADLTATQGCENELTPSDSDSSLTIETSKGRFHQIEDSAKDCGTTWTDEKHDLYLDYLESSFVEQLHRSIGVIAKRVAKNGNTSEKLSQQQDDYLEKIDLKRSHHMFAEFSDQNFADEAIEQMCRKKQTKSILSEV